MRRMLVICGCAAALLLAGCATPTDYTTYRNHFPRSVLVLPPINESVDVNATYGVLSTVTRPLAERGYYVYPVAVTDLFLKENGLPTAGEMHQVPLNKIRDIIGADAVLYLTVHQYGTKYIVIDSYSTVQLSARLVDVKTGALLWQGQVAYSESSSGSDDILASIIVATVNQVVASSTDYAHRVSAVANTKLFTASRRGLLLGPHHSEFKTDWE